MLETINQPIEVVAKFSSNNLTPVKFFWPGHGREILIKKVNLAYSSREGRTKLYFFAVSDDSSYFKLQFNSESLSWTLLEVFSE